MDFLILFIYLAFVVTPLALGTGYALLSFIKVQAALYRLDRKQKLKRIEALNIITPLLKKAQENEQTDNIELLQKIKKEIEKTA